MANNNRGLLFKSDQDIRVPERIIIEEPPIGNKAHCITERGMFVLEASPCLFRAMACTHAGSGGVVVYDGVPDEHGFFPEPPEGPTLLFPDGSKLAPDDWFHFRTTHDLSGGTNLFDPVGNQWAVNDVDELVREWLIDMGTRNGREIYYAHPACMGMWMLDAGCRHGLTIESSGPMDSTPPILTLTWMKHKGRV